VNLVEVVVALVAIIGALSGVIGVLVRLVITSKDLIIAELKVERDYWRRQAGERRAATLDRPGRHPHDPPDKEDDSHDG
jgi:hypothetical protein